MAVDYDEGRRLLAAHKATEAKLREWPSAVDVANEMRASTALSSWLYVQAEALLNPDPWRPISEREDKHKDGRKLDLWVRDYADGGFRVPDCKWGTPWSGAAPCWLELKPHPDARHDWEWQPIDFVPTHFREIKGPGQ